MYKRALSLQVISIQLNRKIIFPFSPIRKCLSASKSYESIRTDILERSLLHVNTLGWKEEAILNAIKDLNLPPLTYSIINRGVYDLVEYFMEKKHTYIKNKLDIKKESEDTTTNPDSLFILLEAHIDFIEPYKSSYASLLSILIDPIELSYTLNSIFRTADEICICQDIRTSRLDWYSERLLAILFYSSIELYAVSDNSDNLVDTRAFLLRNVDFYRNLRDNPNLLEKLKDIIYKILFNIK